MAVEEHGGGAQFVRLRFWPHWRRMAPFVGLQLTLQGLALWAASDSATAVVAILAIGALLLSVLSIRDFSHSMAALEDAWAAQAGTGEQSATSAA
jgi:hypothetical protein